MMKLMMRRETNNNISYMITCHTHWLAMPLIIDSYISNLSDNSLQLGSYKKTLASYILSS